MYFGANMTPVEVIEKGVFGRNYFRDIWYSVNNIWHRKS